VRIVSAMATYQLLISRASSTMAKEATLPTLDENESQNPYIKAVNKVTALVRQMPQQAPSARHEFACSYL